MSPSGGLNDRLAPGSTCRPLIAESVFRAMAKLPLDKPEQGILYARRHRG